MQDPFHRFSRQLSSAASSSSPSASGMARREIARPESAHSEIRSALAFTRSQNSTSSRFGSQSGLSTRSEEQTSELQFPMRISYAGFCLYNNTGTAFLT